MNLLKNFLFLTIILNLLVLNISAKDLDPSKTLLASGAVTDLVLLENKLYAATAASSVDIFDINTNEKIDSLLVPKI